MGPLLIDGRYQPNYTLKITKVLLKNKKITLSIFNKNNLI